MLPWFRKSDYQLTSTGTESNVDGNPVNFEDEEKILAMKLRSLCSPYGVEKRTKLKDSAEILLQLGELYLNRAKFEIGIQQKMSFIRSGVLLHAARVRFELMKDSNDVLETEKLCHELSSNVLTCCGVWEGNLVDVSQKMFRSILQKRDEINILLATELNRSVDDGANLRKRITEKLEILERAESISMSDLELIFSPDGAEKERKLTEKVREVNKNVTNFYKGVMHDIATECLRILPPPPCKFSVVGLGSLAREEATLYSAFEHIILLQDGLDQEENYSAVLEYFRWFSVVFQLVVIGFGETIIPSIALKSLNDTYSGDPDLDWFYDDHTPKGISFDGMMPKACKIPLGRQQATKKRSHIVELIKTPQKMAHLMTSKENLKNGYHLADVLHQTCLVYGDSSIYALFLEERSLIMMQDRIGIAQIYSDLVLQDTIRNVRSKYFSVGQAAIVTQEIFYRPIATYIAVIARSLDVKGSSNFEIIDRLHELGVISPNCYHYLRYAFAVACEIRMKLYHSAGQQRTGTQLESMVGIEPVRVCQDMMLYLKAMVEALVVSRDIGTLSRLGSFFMKSRPSDVIAELWSRGFYEEALKIGNKLRQSMKYADVEFYYTLFQCYNKAGYLQKAEELYLTLQKKNLPIVLAMELDFALACICRNQHQHEKCVAALEKYFDKYLQATQRGHTPRNFMVACYMYYLSISASKLTQIEKDERLKTVLWDRSNELECQLLEQLHFFTRLLQEYDADDEICIELCLMLSDVLKKFKALFFPGYFHWNIARLQISMWWLSEAVETLKNVPEDSESSSNLAFVTNLGDGNPEALKLLCICRLHGKQAVSRVSTSSKQDEALLKLLVSMLWRGLFTSRYKVVRTIVLLWVLQLKTRGEIHNLFNMHRTMQHPRIKFAKAGQMVQHFMHKNTELTHDVDGLLDVYAMLILASSL